MDQTKEQIAKIVETLQQIYDWHTTLLTPYELEMLRQAMKILRQI